MVKKLFSTILFIVFATSAVFAVESRSEFAHKFEDALRNETINVNIQVADIKLTYLRNLLDVLGPNFKYAANLQKYIEEFSSFKADLTEKTFTDEELVRRIVAMKNYLQFKDVHTWLEETGVTYTELIRAGMPKHNFDLKVASNLFCYHMGLAWYNLYEYTPASVLDEFKEFEEANDIFIEMDKEKVDKMPYFDRAMKIIVRLFGYRNWNLLIE